MNTESRIAIAMVVALAGTLLALYCVADVPRYPGTKQAASANCTCAPHVLCWPTLVPPRRTGADAMRSADQGLICTAKP